MNTPDSLIDSLKAAAEPGDAFGFMHIDLDKAIATVRRHYEGRPAVEGTPLEL